MAKDPKVIAEAKQMAEKAYRGGSQKGDVDPMITDKAITIAAVNGDAALYDKVMAVSRSSSDPGEKSDALRTLAMFTAPDLVTRTMDYAVSGEVRNQDSWIPMNILLTDVDTREVAWRYIESHWDKVHAQLTTNSGARVVSAAGNFCSAEKHDEVASFFATHKVDAAERTLAKALDSINDCVQLRAVQQPALHQWLTMQAR
jgi:aminopeptidase N/puromycin-sensitive aminopeptidase